MSGGLFGNGAGPRLVDVNAFFDSDLPSLIASIVEMGVLVSVGTTRDRGALSLTITADGQYDREYFRDSDAASDYLRNAAVALRGLGFEHNGTPPPEPQKPVRGRRKLV